MALAKERSVVVPHEISPCHAEEFEEMKSTSNSTSGGCGKNKNNNFNNNNSAIANSYAPSVINFSGFASNSEHSLLSFDQQSKEEYYCTNPDQSYQWNQMNVYHNPRFSSDFNCFQTASDFGSSISNSVKGDGSFNGWLYSEATVISDSFDESAAGTQESEGFNKRPHVEESTTTQALKKQCISTSATNKKPKVQKSSPSKDPQSIAAKNRRERISERLKVLQELVPNGSKVDLVTMLEKAISYVKFLQLQVKVLATDEFWPVQGGKAPDISQVKEAIDAILSSQRDRNSSSK